ncbi:uncharacterized protein N0V89_004792 [Didymosphaeria variabile]|uniref:EthD domain-containing protein n=1 Tax=Didymosphaeria variabile TaxID=1932322 RepID=A0A9W9CDX0_9PLEO|nr:uncharacterized protein N0V89_004792 [Didymosphaeria variabile]KAJ4356756.1 hypothetical protein N0V89_004792 [Didymosphaeria variabile]
MSPTTTQLVIAYPSSDPTTGSPLTFNMAYYTGHHVALATKIWGPSGLKSWFVVEFANPNPFSGETPPYLFQSTLTWDVPPEEVLKAVMNSGEELGPDVVNFTNVEPVLWVAKAGPSGVVGE